MEGMNVTLNPILTDNETTKDTFLQDTETYLTLKVARYISKYWFPVLIRLGLVGNTLSFLVMIRPNNRKVSTCIYMTAISINDNAMMCIEVHAWLVDAVKIHGWYDWECKYIVYLEHFVLQCATYLILAMTFDKYVAIKWPHKAATYSSPRRAKIITFAIVTSVATYNIGHFFITALADGNCYGYSAKIILTKVYSWSTIVLNAIIPFTLLIHMNYVIVKTVRQSRKIFRSDVGGRVIDKRDKSMKNVENQLTTMLLLVTTLFLILLLPTYIRFIYAAFVISDTPYKFATSILIFEISYKLYVTNSGINFFLYCVSGHKFRNDLKEIVCCIGRSSPSAMKSNFDTNTSGVQSEDKDKCDQNCLPDAAANKESSSKVTWCVTKVR